MWRRAKARREVTIVVPESVVQKKLWGVVSGCELVQGVDNVPQTSWQFSGGIEI
jgi:hypothetical protein